MISATPWPLLIIVLAVLAASPSVRAQTPTLRILGEYRERVEPDGYSMRLLLSENPATCDPVVGFLTVEQQLERIVDSIDSRGGNPAALTMITLGSAGEYPYRAERVEVQTSDPRTAYFLKWVAHNYTTVEEQEFYFNGITKIDEDRRAVAAFLDARQRALAIANGLGFSSVRVRGLDDDTRSPIIDKYDTCGCMSAKQRLALLEILKGYLTSVGKVDTKGTMRSNQPVYESAYQLWVEFECVL